MWLSGKIFGLLEVAKESVSALREELAAVKSERDTLKSSLAHAQHSFDWLRVRTNTLEIERAQLVEKLYGLKVPTPEIVRQAPSSVAPLDFNSAIFDDVGDTLAKHLGLPTYDN